MAISTSCFCLSELQNCLANISTLFWRCALVDTTSRRETTCISNRINRIQSFNYCFIISSFLSKGQWEKNELVARVFSASENGVKPIKTAVEFEADLKTEYLAKLKINDRNIPDPFKIPHGRMTEDKGMKFWAILLYPDIFNYLNQVRLTDRWSTFYETRMNRLNGQYLLSSVINKKERDSWKVQSGSSQWKV